MDFIPIKTRKFIPERDKGNLFKLLNDYLPRLKEKDVVVITSKIVSIHQGRIVKITKKTDRIQLIKQEADAYFSENPSSMTIKNHTLTPYAGIDRSNGLGHYILWPQSPQSISKTIWQYLKNKFHLKNLGVIISDSTCHPLRLGHFGVAIGWYGFKPLYDYKNRKDIFGRRLKNHRQNLVDALTALAVVFLGEGNEQTPILIVRNFNKLKFSSRMKPQELWIDQQADLYGELLHFLHVAHRIQK